MNDKVHGLVSDEHGKPLKVYHGSEHPTLLDENRATFFSVTPNVANAYALHYNDDYIDGCIVFSAYLTIKKPLVTTREFLVEYALNNLSFNKVDSFESQIDVFANNFEDSYPKEREIIFQFAQENGYDGVVITEDSLPVECLGGDWDLQKSYVVFSANQIHFYSPS